MNGTDNNDLSKEQNHGTDPLAELFRLASPRLRPPADDEKVIRQVLNQQWRAMTRRKQKNRWILPWAIAALLVLSIVAVIDRPPVTGLPEAVQHVAFANKIIGQATVQTSMQSVALQDIPLHELKSGQKITMGPASRAALNWVNGAVIRLDERTELSLDSENEIFLVSGRIYMDTAAVNRVGSPVIIRTPHGIVQHLGTQFMAQVSRAGTSVSVREGEVAWFPSPELEDERTLAGKGQLLAVTPGGHVAVEPIRTWGAEWEWAERLSPGFAADGRSVADLLLWVGRESGRQIEYSSASAETVAKRTILRGDLDLQPMQALSVATATSDLHADINDGVIIIGLNTPL